MFLTLLSLVGICQSNKIAVACNSVNNLDSTKFHYVIREKGTELLQVLRQDDIKNCTKFLAFTLDKLVSKDKTLKKLPEIKENTYALWNDELNMWTIQNGGLKDLIKSYQTKQETECKLMQNGKFKYLKSTDTSAYIIRKGTKHTEHYQNDKYFADFDIKWISDCAYKLTFVKTNDPGLSFLNKGDELIVHIESVNGNRYDYKSNLKGNISNGTNIKIE